MVKAVFLKDRASFQVGVKIVASEPERASRQSLLGVHLADRKGSKMIPGYTLIKLG